jgi:uncharacterized protein (DUF2336 family)
MSTEQSLIAELESAMKSGSRDKRVDTLRRITDLFVASADRFDDREIDVFNGVMEHLVKRIEGKALAELSRRLGPIKNAPSGVVRRLAHDEDIAVAEPVLAQSACLSDADLIEIANSKTQAHLLAISGRSQIDRAVTDALLQRGDRQVFHKLAENHGAGFSENGFATLVKHSEGDERLAEKVGLRHDVPLPLYRELLSRATEVVRSRLLNAANPEIRSRIQSTLAAVSDDEQQLAGFQNEHDFAEAHARVAALHAKGELRESTLLEYARMEHYADMIAALSLLCGAPMQLVENLLQSKHRESFLIPCKIAGLQWQTVCIMMTFRSVGKTLSGDEHDSMWADYLKLSPAAAARVIRFWQVRQAAAKEAPAA